MVGIIRGGGPATGDDRPPIRRNSLREQIAEALLEEMMAGRFPAGRNFTVKEIAELYGVSATPAREALVDLAAQGLLNTEHNRGFTVPSFSWEDFLEIFEARTLLTDNALRHLSGRIERYDWARLPSLRRRADAAARASRVGQLDVLVGCDLRFWREAAALLCNERIAGYLSWLRVQSWMFAAPHLRAADHLGGVCWDRHGELVDRIEARDAAGAHRLLNAYNLFTVELLARLLGKSLESVAVLALLREQSDADDAAGDAGDAGDADAGDPDGRAAVPEAGATPEQPADDAAAEPGAVPVGLGRVPLPRFVPPGRFARQLRPVEPVRQAAAEQVRPESGEPAPGR